MNIQSKICNEILTKVAARTWKDALTQALKAENKGRDMMNKAISLAHNTPMVSAGERRIMHYMKNRGDQLRRASMNRYFRFLDMDNNRTYDTVDKIRNAQDTKKLVMQNDMLRDANPYNVSFDDTNKIWSTVRDKYKYVK